ncbi:NAD(P)/FAD-dependent oxidoreductase [Hylemonella gracilis]|uniref:NAD(P)/FAD-dependent oxidoreductase n=1 Tax=Hylemonella gracilis TaxID=80880 RepID=A0A4P6UKW2_9BURK|nr:NAD(P)/FAD-dependent oxidoreductase [Hylemonella gracilis]QBK06018.1 NAD(P)/FAD-dependent oxidoreductase [Hylemonella gracilis]
MQQFDVVVIGAGAAGLFCAGVAGQRGLKVLLIDHAAKVAEKIRISGGGRCNFTNRDLDPRAPHKHYLGANPDFCRSALARYTPADFIALLQDAGIPWHEKHKGQLFCDRSADDIIQLLLRECAAGGVTHWQPCAVQAVRHRTGDTHAPVYELDTERGPVQCHSLVVATGGLSIPKVGATDFGHRLARQFGLNIVVPRPALVPLTFDGAAWGPYAGLAGLALPVRIEVAPPVPEAEPERANGPLKRPGGKGRPQGTAFLEDLLFTHRGLSGPAVLQISSYWQTGTPLRVDLLPGQNIGAHLVEAKQQSRKLLVTELAALLPTRLAEAWTAQDPAWQRPVADTSDKALAALAERLTRWMLTPTGSEGYAKAEVTAGGVDTRELSSQTLEARAQPGLYFIGEVVDVTGWLGGYNFQWAWASAHACAMALVPTPR